MCVTACTQREEDNLLASAFPTPYVGSGDGTHQAWQDVPLLMEPPHSLL